jgi:3-oxoacyl-(acyl-carrier-protein) synthase
MGVISALGLDREGFWQSLANGQSGIGPIPQDVGPVPEMGMNQVRFKNGAAVLGYEAETYFPRKTLSFMDRFALRSSPVPAWAAGIPTKSVIGNSSTMAGIASTH